MQEPNETEVIFQHLINLPGCSCCFASAFEQISGKRRLFLITSDEQKIYKRNAIKETWDELLEEGECETIRNGFHAAIEERKIPCYQAQDLDIF